MLSLQEEIMQKQHSISYPVAKWRWQQHKVFPSEG
jgi:hypothetical protein